MGVIVGIFLFVAVGGLLLKSMEAGIEGSEKNVPFIRMFIDRWAVTKGNYSTVYVFRGRWYGPTVFVEVDSGSGNAEAEAIEIAKYANEHKLRGLPNLNRRYSSYGRGSALEYVKNWHESGGGKGGKVIEV